MGSGRSGGVNDIGDESFLEERGVKTLIQDWERRAGGGEEVHALQLPSDNKNTHRRVSEDFTRARLKFVNSEEGGGMDRQTAKPKISFASISTNEIFFQVLMFLHKVLQQDENPKLQESQVW